MISSYSLIYVQVDDSNINIAYDIQKNEWKKDPDYDDIYDKAINTKDDNVLFLVYDGEKLIGLTGVDVYRQYPDTIWLDWFTILDKYRRHGYGEKVLLDTINYCKSLRRYKTFRVETTYYKDRPALYLYDKVMQLKEEYTIEDTKDSKTNTIIYSYPLNGKLEPWNNRYLGLRKYYNGEKAKENFKHLNDEDITYEV